MSNIAIKGAATGTGVFTLESPATNTNRTLTLPDSAGTILTTATAGVPIGGPAFRATRSASQQVITTSTNTKVQFNLESFDTNSCFDSTTNYRFTPNVAGYYQLNSFLQIDGFASGNIEILIYKNGAAISFSNVGPAGVVYPVVGISDVLYANGSTDYFEIYVTQNSGSNKNIYAGGAPVYCWFSGSMTRSAT
tara:strand:+ start:154 stop:732 length:579 start_codon:yes stop_codon:yes gene_type:complete